MTETGADGRSEPALSAAHSFYQRLRARVLRTALRCLVRSRARTDVECFGTDYGGHAVPTSLVEASWICYSAGVGEDVSFDLELIRRFGCHVFAFDPTPRAVAFAERVATREPRFAFMAIGLWSRDGRQTFYAPRDPSHVSYSIDNLQRTTRTIVAPVRTVRSLMEELGHDHLDLLKLDIEGAEFEVLDSVLDDGIRPKVLCVEIDQPVRVRRLVRLLRRLRREDYLPVRVDRWDLTFVAGELAGRSR